MAFATILASPAIFVSLGFAFGSVLLGGKYGENCWNAGRWIWRRVLDPWFSFFETEEKW